MTHPQRVIDLAVEEVKLQYKGRKLERSIEDAIKWDIINCMVREDTGQWRDAWSKAYNAWDYSLLEKRVKENHWKAESEWLNILSSEQPKKMSKLQEIINKAFFTEKLASKAAALITEAREVKNRFDAVAHRANEAQTKIDKLMYYVEMAFENQNKEKYIYYTKQLEAVLDFIEKDKEANTLSMLGGKVEKKVEEKYDPSV